ncbi:Hypothetical_protein [Hexamita inflata]|uniref:Hypothetical_protein n=1 Tax=Hexamita inflata TaxID=28002 RepID=A0ABP1GKY9_9EUKA
MNLLPMHHKRLSVEKLFRTLPITDLFAPAVPEEHCLSPLLNQFYKVMFEPIPPETTNDECFCRFFNKEQFPWSVQIDGEPGTGKTALLKLLTRQSLLYYLPERQLQTVEVLRNTQIDEKEFNSWVKCQYDKLLNAQQMTSLSAQMELKYQKKRERKLKNQIDFQLKLQEIVRETIDINESPLQQLPDNVSSLSIDDCQDFYLSELESHFAQLYMGGGIRPVLFANNSPSLSCQRYLARDINKPKSLPMFNYVYNFVWKEETDAAPKEVKITKNSGIDKFIIKKLPTTSQPIECDLSDDSIELLDTNQIILHKQETEVKLDYKYEVNELKRIPRYISTVLYANQQLNYLNKVNTTEYKIKKNEISPCLYEFEKQVLKSPFYSINRSKDHFTPIPASFFVNLNGNITYSKEQISEMRDKELEFESKRIEQQNSSSDFTSFSSQINLQEQVIDSDSLLNKCADQIIFSCIHSQQLRQQKEFNLDEIKCDQFQLKCVQKYIKQKCTFNCLNLRMVCNYSHWLIELVNSEEEFYKYSEIYNLGIGRRTLEVIEEDEIVTMKDNQSIFKIKYQAEVQNQILLNNQKELIDYLLSVKTLDDNYSEWYFYDDQLSQQHIVTVQELKDIELAAAKQKQLFMDVEFNNKTILDRGWEEYIM